MAPSASAAPARLFVDSSAWLAFFSARDRMHAEADRLLRAAIGLRIPLLTSNLVLAEVHRLLLYRAGLAPAVEAMRRIEAGSRMRILFPDEGAHRAALGWIERLKDQVITYTDATSFALMQSTRTEHVLTFDSDFAVAGFTPWGGPD